MNEDFQKEINQEEKQKEDFLIHSLEYRNPFQILVFKMLRVENDVELVMKYSKLIRSIIDNPDNSEVRKLILQKKFEEAAKAVVDEINREEHLPRAA